MHTGSWISIGLIVSVLVASQVTQPNPDRLAPEGRYPDQEQREHIHSAIRCTTGNLLTDDEAYDNYFLYLERIESSPSSLARLTARADNGDPQAMYDLALLLISLRESEEDGLSRLQQAAQLGHAGAQTEYGGSYFFPALGQEQNFDVAEEWLTRAVAQGDHVGAYALYLLYSAQDRVDDAAAALLVSASGCYPAALAKTAEYSERGHLLRRNRALALHLQRTINIYLARGGTAPFD